MFDKNVETVFVCLEEDSSVKEYRMVYSDSESFFLIDENGIMRIVKKSDCSIGKTELEALRNFSKKILNDIKEINKAYDAMKNEDEV